jgi:hypothetical protein
MQIVLVERTAALERCIEAPDEEAELKKIVGRQG